MPFQTVAFSPKRRNTPMVFRYYPDTDMLYIELVSGVSTESKEVVPGIV
ncbi:MAG: DUF2283 domain-containing protein, partial [Candidatus Binatia bacterium]